MADGAHAARVKARRKRDFNGSSMPAESDSVAKTSEGKKPQNTPSRTVRLSPATSEKQIKREGIYTGDGLQQQ